MKRIYWLDAEKCEVSVYDGELRHWLLSVKTEHGTVFHYVRVNAEIINKSRIETELLIAKQLAEIVEERDALKEELEALKETNEEAAGTPV